MQLTGIHHLTAISAHAKGNLAFYTGVLGMRLVKRPSIRTMSAPTICSMRTGRPILKLT